MLQVQHTEWFTRDAFKFNHNVYPLRLQQCRIFIFCTFSHKLDKEVDSVGNIDVDKAV